MARAAAAVGIDYGSLSRLLVRYALRRKRALQQAGAAAFVARVQTSGSAQPPGRQSSSSGASG
jgi:hypothetical protein